MSVTRERFEQGLTYEQYKAQMTRNRDRLDAAEHGFTPSESELGAFRGLRRPVNVLAIAEDWCGDVIANLPILAKLAAESSKLNVRVFLRDQNLDLIDQYLKEGKYRSIPVFVFFDDSFQELGHFIERPASVTELRARKRLELYAQNPEFGSPDSPVDQLPEDVRVRLAQATAQQREETTPWANSEVVRELGAIIDRVPAGS